MRVVRIRGLNAKYACMRACAEVLFKEPSAPIGKLAGQLVLQFSLLLKLPCACDPGSCGDFPGEAIGAALHCEGDHACKNFGA